MCMLRLVINCFLLHEHSLEWRAVNCGKRDTKANIPRITPPSPPTETRVVPFDRKLAHRPRGIDIRHHVHFLDQTELHRGVSALRRTRFAVPLVQPTSPKMNSARSRSTLLRVDTHLDLLVLSKEIVRMVTVSSL